MDRYVKLHVMHCGDVTLDRALPFREETWHPAPYTGLFRSKDKRVTMPCSSYLLEHPDGLVLVDTGWHEQVRTDLRGQIGFLNSLAFTGRLPQGAAVHEQLQARGIDPRRLEYVLLSHLHADHVSGLHHVRDAKRILTSELEWDAAQREFGYVRKMWEGIPIDTFSLEEVAFGPYGKGFDLFGDGLITLVFTPGHTRGHHAVVVKTERGYVLLAGDVGYATRSWREFILPGVLADKQQAIDSLRWVQAFEQREDCVAVLANHDPDVRPGVF